MHNLNQFHKNWLFLAVCSIAGAGIYSLPPVMLRGSHFKNLFNLEDIFASSLVIHVNSSVLFWMLAIGCMLWSRFYKKEQDIFHKAAFYSAAIALVLVLVSPLIGAANPLKNNYIPVLQNPVFFLGLGFFVAAILIEISIVLLNIKLIKKGWLEYGLYCTSLIMAVALICFLIAAFKVDMFDSKNPTMFYEYLFWGGGHILQSAYVNFLIIAWFILFGAALEGQNSGKSNKNINSKFLFFVFTISVILVLPAPFFYLEADSTELFTIHMRYFMPVAVVLATIFIVYEVVRLILTKRFVVSNKYLFTFLLLSLILFNYGGLLGFLISGVNVTIPAHYHGSIVGITIAFMGLVYYFLEQIFGKVFVLDGIAKSQPIIYGVGQIMHITGLWVMGGYGALRKDAASSASVDTVIGKIMFFAGGAMAIAGGLIFVFLVVRYLLRVKRAV